MANRHDVQHIHYAAPAAKKEEAKSAACKPPDPWPILGWLLIPLVLWAYAELGFFRLMFCLFSDSWSCR